MQKTDKIKMPFNPIYILLLSSLFTFLIGGILFAINNDRLKHNNNKTKNIIITCLIFSTFCFLVYYLPDFEYDFFILHSIHAVAGLIFCVNQKNLYNTYATKNNKKSLNLAIILLIFLLSFCINMVLQFAHDYNNRSSIAIKSMTKARELVEEKKFDQALCILHEIEKDYPKKEILYYAIAVTHWSKGDDKNALRALEMSLKYNPNYESAKELLKTIKEK